ncbi:NERD domain-containing protein [Caldibacillus thermolactis]|jgi:hypothetical protein|uniref:NERD domain-containing protein n=1 Tax=Pallidibacillus thermolactis TaxID=251051 RepID=A0ABT2WB08_9BACI|nr:NERD domain-containing protein [Pallidibacillus thermolactis]MCU9592868.1 NERD domain-containing protein [Pallidibacillus thermolactis]
MFIKPFTTPFDANQLIALNRRVKSSHKFKPRILKDYNLSMAGLYGEKEVYYLLKQLPQGQYYILYNIRIKDTTGFFQIDYILLSVKFILIIEVKNYVGKVYFNKFNQLQLIKTENQEEVLQNPINQVERQQLLLQNWLFEHHYSNIPIYSYVVFSSPTTLIKTDSPDPNIYNKIISGSNLVPKIFELSNSSTKRILKSSDVKLLATLLKDSHTPYEIDIEKKYHVQYNDLMKGIHCPVCSAIPMQKDGKKWICKNCHYVGENNYLQSLNDYYYLVSKEITNQQARDFLNIRSEHTMFYLLKKADYQAIGKNKGRKYVIQIK